MNIREESENREARELSPRAALAKDSAGRDMPEEPCPIRTVYQRDRDRILHCKAFRRLMHKTQVFLSPSGDHYRTRLTHTLEVSQIARTIARALKLNEDLTEAVALGHDLGHTPFGHAGERVLGKINPAGYRHYEQSVRIVEKLENAGQGLNLTQEVRDGILCHTTGPVAKTLEGQIVRYADKIAYMNHDVDDAVRAGILTEKDLPDEVKTHLGKTRGQRLNKLILAVIDQSGEEIMMDEETEYFFSRFKDFLFESVYTNPVAKAEESKAEQVVAALYEYFTKDGEKLPSEYKKVWEQDGIDRAVCDYISGMSDRYATVLYGELFVPKSWEVIDET